MKERDDNDENALVNTNEGERKVGGLKTKMQLGCRRPETIFGGGVDVAVAVRTIWRQIQFVVSRRVLEVQR